MKKTMTINKEQGLFVIHSGGGWSCLGFEVCRKRHDSLAAELGKTPFVGSLNNKRHLARLYRQYNQLCKEAAAKHKATGWRSKSQLTPELIGLEGKRVEVITSWGEVERFYVGKSTGFIPCHLAIKRKDSTGGCAVVGSPFKSVRVLY